MKKFFAIALVLGLAVSAQAASLDMVVGGGDSIDLAPGESATIEAWFRGPADNGFFSFVMGLEASTEDGFTFDSIAAGPAMYDQAWTSAQPNGSLSAWQGQNYVYPTIQDVTADILLFSATITATADTGSVQVMFDDLNAGAEITGIGSLPYSDVTFGDSVMVNFVPEPASLALIALGGLALIRRR